jgi:hypothetical protein
MRMPRSLAASLNPSLRTAGKRLLGGRSYHVIESFPAFAPNSGGSWRLRASLASQGARQTFLFMLDLLTSTGIQIDEAIPIALLADTDEKKDAAVKLMALFEHYGSDKPNHDYHLLYGAILAKRDCSAVLEIGLGTTDVRFVSHMHGLGKPGSSLRAFRDFLPDARVYGADIDRSVLFEEDRIATFFVDQTDPSSFSALAACLPREFDLIIDDGLHAPNANLATLTFGIGRLKVGGCLVIEDISAHALAIWQVVAAALLPPHYSARVVAASDAFLFVVNRHA